MLSKHQNYSMNDLNKQIITIWINKADHDLGSAKIIFKHIPNYFDTIAFHCQQAVEKYIKASLIYFEIEFQKSHDLIYFLELLSIKIEIIQDLFDKAIILNRYSVEIRYPNQIIHLTDDELRTAISIAEEFREFITKTIGFTEN